MSPSKGSLAIYPPEEQINIPEDLSDSRQLSGDSELKTFLYILPRGQSVQEPTP